MEPDIKTPTTPTVEAQQPSSFNTELPGQITKPKTAMADQPWQEWLEMGVEYLSKLTDIIGDFLVANQKPLLNLALLLAAIVSVYLILALIDAINSFPLLAPILELVGLGYSGWFIIRYLLKASTRSELLQEFEALKAQVVGDESQDS